MKKAIYIIIAVVSLSFTACETTGSSDGDLNNWWYLTQVDTLANGKTAEYREQRVFWSFQGTLMQIEKAGEEKYVCKFQNTDGRIYQNQLYLYDRIHGDVLMNEDSIRVRKIDALGINQPVDTFIIESLDGSNMILRDRMLRLHFENY